MKSFRLLFAFVVAVTFVAGDVAPRYRELPKENCLPPDLAAQMAAHCVLDMRDRVCCEAVVASLDTGYRKGPNVVPCFCSVTEELLPRSAFISIDDVIDLYFACHGTASRTEIELTVFFCTGEALAPSKDQKFLALHAD